MTIRFRCPKCQTSIKTSDAFVGRKAKCPKCQRSLIVPSKNSNKVLNISSGKTNYPNELPVSSQYWIKQDQKIWGPYTIQELFKMHRIHSIKSDDHISHDQRHWISSSIISYWKKSLSSDITKDIDSYEDTQIVSVRYIIETDSNTHEEPAIIVLSDDLFAFKAKSLEKLITVPYNEFLVNAKVSDAVLTLETGKKLIQCKLSPESANQLLEMVEFWHDRFLSSNCPKCKKKGYKSGACSQCGYINWAWMIIKIAIMGFLSLIMIGLIFAPVGDERTFLILGGLIGLVKICWSLYSSVLQPIAQANDAKE